MTVQRATPAVPVLLAVQNQGVPQDVRVTGFARTLVKAGYRVAILAPSRPNQPTEEEIDGFVVHRFREPPDGAGITGYAREVSTSLWRMFRRRWGLIARHTSYILHVCNPPDVLWAPFLGHCRRTVRIYDQHDLVPELYLAKGGRRGSLPHRALLAMERTAYRWADLVLAPNQTYARVAASRGRVSNERIHVVRNAPRPDLWYPGHPSSAFREGADFVLCYVGGIAQQDGVDELVRAMAWTRQADTSRRYLCLVVGHGSALGAVQGLTRSLQMEDSVRFFGWISDPATLREIVASADVGIEPCPSNAFNDASSMIKLTEYLAAGRPVVAYDLPEHRITVGDAGVLVAPDQGAEGLGAAIVRMASDRTALGRFAQNATGRLASGNLSAARSAAALVGAYTQARLLGASRGAKW